MKKSKLKEFLKNKEHNTIYIETTIYILFTILIIFSSLVGPMYIKFIPLVFICGMVGNSIFNRPIITAIFGFLISLCTIKLTGIYDIKYNLIYSIYIFICILLGEISGKFLTKVLSDKRKKVSKEYIKNFCICIIITIIGICINNYVNGNVYNYLMCKRTLSNYISTNYNVEEKNIIIKGNKYVFEKYKYYSYFISGIDDSKKEYKFSVYSDNKIIDGYHETLLLEESRKINFKLNKYNLKLNEGYKCELRYKENLDNLVLKVIYKSSNKDLDLNIFANNVNNILNEVLKLKDINNIQKLEMFAETKDKINIGEVYSLYFGNLDKYIESMNTEFLDF